MDTNYNGWKNLSTWNVMLWINNEYALYHAAVEFMKSYKGRCPYASFIRYMGLSDNSTPDNINWKSDALSYKELNEAMVEFRR